MPSPSTPRRIVPLTSSRTRTPMRPPAASPTGCSRRTRARRTRTSAALQRAGVVREDEPRIEALAAVQVDRRQVVDADGHAEPGRGALLPELGEGPREQ